MFDQARAIQMPAAFVELRHEATHGEMPSLQRLMHSTGFALDWLWSFYWSRLEGFATHLCAHRPVSDALQTIFHDLREFLTERRSEIKAQKGHSLDSKAALKTCVKLVSICKDDFELPFTLGKVLVDERSIVPSNRRYVILLERFNQALTCV